jgi:hypothetical protein
MILTYTKDFSWKEKDLNSPDFDFDFLESPDFYDKSQQIVKNIDPFCYFLLSYLVCSRIWLNCF